MASTDYKIVHELILELLSTNLVKVGMKPEDISDDIDLLQTGILDSFDFLDLIVAIEENSELSVELSEMGDLNVAVLGNLIKGIVQQNSQTVLDIS